jgi:putative transposase
LQCGPRCVRKSPGVTRAGAQSDPAERKWSMNFVAARLLDGRAFRLLTVVDHFTRECLLFLAGSSLTGQRMVLALSQVIIGVQATRTVQ